MSILAAPNLTGYVTALIAALRADAGVTAIVGQRAYTHVPQEAQFPYAKASFRTKPWNTKGSRGYEVELVMQTWAKDDDIASLLNMQKALADLLNDSTLGSSASSQTVLTLFVADSIFPEPDGRTHQLNSTFRILITPTNPS